MQCHLIIWKIDHPQDLLSVSTRYSHFTILKVGAEKCFWEVICRRFAKPWSFKKKKGRALEGTVAGCEWPLRTPQLLVLSLFLQIQGHLREWSIIFIFNAFSKIACGDFGTNFDVPSFCLLGVSCALKKKILTFPRSAFKKKKKRTFHWALDVNLFSC